MTDNPNRGSTEPAHYLERLGLAINTDVANPVVAHLTPAADGNPQLALSLATRPESEVVMLLMDGTATARRLEAMVRAGDLDAAVADVSRAVHARVALEDVEAARAADADRITITEDEATALPAGVFNTIADIIRTGGHAGVVLPPIASTPLTFTRLVPFDFTASCDAAITGHAGLFLWQDLPDLPPQLARQWEARDTGQPWTPSASRNASRIHVAEMYRGARLLQLDSRGCHFTPTRLQLAGRISVRAPYDAERRAWWTPADDAYSAVRGLLTWTLRAVYGHITGSDPLPEQGWRPGQLEPLPGPVTIHLTQRDPAK